MNIEHLRKTLKAQWLNYYRENRSWLTRLGMWVNCEGKRRPSSSFILGTLATLEPELVQILPLVVDLSSNPDRIILALGLNFNPDEELAAIAELDRAPSRSLAASSLPAAKVAALPDSQAQISVVPQAVARSERASELRSAKAPPQQSVQPPAQSSTQLGADVPPSHSSDALSNADSPNQVTVPVRKIVDPPVVSPAQPETSAKPDASKLSGVPLPGGSSLTELPSRFPANGTPDNRLAARRLPLDTAILSAGQLPDRNPSDSDSPSTAQPPDDTRP
jgi:Family of unknown function (DUF5331)